MHRHLSILVLGMVCVAPPCGAQNRAAIRKLCARLEKKHSIKLHFESIPATTWKLGHALADEKDFAKLHRYLLLFDEEFGKYPRTFLEKTKLRCVVFVKALAVKKQKRAAVPDYGKEVLLLDFLRGAHNRTYQRHVIHHEFYHMIEEELNESAYWKDPDWARLNDSAFRYGRGGKEAQKDKRMYAFTHPRPGFVNLYSTSALEEDKAEVYAALFLAEESAKLLEWGKKDKVLFEKAAYMRAFLKKIDPKFSPKYWAKLHEKD